jgi:predicted dehydrogenase
MREHSRRQFIQDSVLAAGLAASLPASCLLAAEKGKSRPPKKKPGELLHVAVVGVGGRGMAHLDAFIHSPDTVITYVVDTDRKIGPRRAEAVTARQGHAPKFVADIRTALDDKSVDIVSIATPNHWHALGAIWAMQAGKDVYVEKPVSHNVTEGRRIVETARRHNRVCQTGTQCRSMQGTIDAIEYVKSGKIGQVKLARTVCYRRRDSVGPKGNYEVPREVDYSLWCGPSRMLPLTRPKFHYDWHWQREWGNGDMGNQGPHQVDIARWGLGLDRLPDRVIAYGGRLGYEDAGDVANTQVGIFDFGDKTLVTEVRGLPTKPLRGALVGVIFYGTEGSVVLASYTDGAAFDPQGKRVRTFGGSGDHFGNFVDAVKARDPKRLRDDVLEGHLSCAISHLANISYYLGKPTSIDEFKNSLNHLHTNENAVDCLDRMIAHLAANGVQLTKTPMSLGPLLKIDPQRETILDNAEAVALLTRDYRAPFVVPKTGEV